MLPIEQTEILNMLPLIKYLAERETNCNLLMEVRDLVSQALLKLPTHLLPAANAEYNVTLASYELT